MNFNCSPKIKLFKAIEQKDSAINYYYYHCFHCSYKTSKISNYKSHLQAKHKNEFKIFLQTALSNTRMSDNLNYDYDELNDSNPTSILPSKHNNKSIYFQWFLII